MDVHAAFLFPIKASSKKMNDRDIGPSQLNFTQLFNVS